MAKTQNAREKTDFSTLFPHDADFSLIITHTDIYFKILFYFKAFYSDFGNLC